jgi:hypothetical protein
VAPLTERAQTLQPIVGRVAVEVGRGENDARRSEPSCLPEVWPTGWPPPAIPPCPRLIVEPSAVWQAAEAREVGPATALAPGLERSGSEPTCSARANLADKASASQVGWTLPKAVSY